MMSKEPEAATATHDYIVTGQVTERRERQTNQGPIDKLPVETLAEIFKLLKMTLPPFHFSISILPAIIHVNRKWRAVATSYSFLWSELDITPNIPECYLERAGVRPLSLCWTRQASNNDSLARYSKYFPRARKLFLDGTPDDNGALAFSGLTSFPLLEHLSIISSTLSTTPEVFISGHYPRLVFLKITLAGDFQWNHAIFSPNLLLLRVHCRTLHRPLLLVDLVKALQHMPLLECLQLMSLRLETEEVGDWASAVPLQRLQYLFLSGPLVECTTVLKCLKLPLSANIDMGCVVPVDHDNAGNAQIPDGALLKLSEALGEKIAFRDKEGTLLSPMKYMLVSQFEHQYPCLENTRGGVARLRCARNDKACTESLKDNLNFFDKHWGQGITSPGMVRKGSASIEVMLFWPCSTDTKFQPLPSSWVVEFCQALPLEEVTTVTLDLSPNMTSMGIGRMCPNITTLFTRSMNPSCGLHNLLDVDENGHCQNRLHFPKLKALLLGSPDHDRPTMFYDALDRLHLCLQTLHTSRTLTLEQILLTSTNSTFSRSEVQRLEAKLEAFKAAFPRISLEWMILD